MRARASSTVWFFFASRRLPTRSNRDWSSDVCSSDLVEGRAQFEGVGVYYDATPMEAQMCEGELVVVVGGANSAGQATVFLAEHASKVLLLIRGDELGKGMSRYLSRRIEQTKNIELLTNTEIARMTGKGHLEAIEIRDNRTGGTRMV